jgi:hypothetical protein
MLAPTINVLHLTNRYVLRVNDWNCVRYYYIVIEVKDLIPPST